MAIHSLIVGCRGGTRYCFPYPYCLLLCLKEHKKHFPPPWFAFSTTYFISSLFIVGMLPRYRLWSYSTHPVHLDNNNYYSPHKASHSALYPVDRYLINTFKLSMGWANCKHADRGHALENVRPEALSVTSHCRVLPPDASIWHPWGDMVPCHTVEGLWCALILCCLEFQLQRESLSPEEIQSVREHLGYHSDSLLSVQITGKKPNFEVGSSSQLKLSTAKKSSGEMA